MDMRHLLRRPVASGELLDQEASKDRSGGLVIIEILGAVERLGDESVEGLAPLLLLGRVPARGCSKVCPEEEVRRWAMASADEAKAVASMAGVEHMRHRQQ